MCRRIFFALLLLGLSTHLWSAELGLMVSCQRDGEQWLCAEWRNGQVKVFQSETYQSALKIKRASPDNPLSKEENEQAATVPVAPQLLEPQYTLQVIACQTIACLKRMNELEAIPASWTTDLENQDKLWRILLVGEYPTHKSALKAAGELIVQYQLKKKPWVRSLESIRSHEIQS